MTNVFQGGPRRPPSGLAGKKPDLFYALTRGVAGLSRRAMAPPEMWFAPPGSIRASEDLAYRSGKFFLGVIDGEVHTTRARSGATERYVTGGRQIGVADDQHVLTVAGTRSGKGRSAIIPNMLRYPGSVIAIDPKGELAKATAQTRKALGHDVYIIDPFCLTHMRARRGRAPILPPWEPSQAGFNPLAFVEEETLVEDAALIADALVMFDKESDPHWAESARTFIEGVIMLVVTSPLFEGRRDLVTVYRLVGSGLDQDPPEGHDKLPPMALLETAMRTSPVEAVRIAGADFFDRPERERGSVLSMARRQLRPVAFPEIADSLSRGGLDLADLKRKPTTIYVCLPGRHLSTCGRWLRLFINQALQAMERKETQLPNDCPVLFILDEFAALGPMRQIEDAAGQIAGYGVKLWVVLQDLGQLKALYRERWETFLGNAGVLQFFGNSDLTTLEWISKRLGRTAIEVTGGSDVTPEGRASGARGESYSTQMFNLLEPEGIALAFGRADPVVRQLIIRPGYQPMILQRAYYDKHEAFKR